MRTKILIGLFITLIVFSLSGCSINIATETPDLALTAEYQALVIQQTQVAQELLLKNSQNQPTPEVIVVTATPGATTATPESTATATAQQPEIVNSTLCWVGPGKKYEVVSSLSKGQIVQVIGRGSTTGWIIVKDPIYTDPCWVQANDIQLDPSTDINSLEVFYPPTPTATP